MEIYLTILTQLTGCTGSNLQYDRDVTSSADIIINPYLWTDDGSC